MRYAYTVGRWLLEKESRVPPSPLKYRDKRTARFAEGQRVKEFHPFERQASKLLKILDAAPTKEALKLLPSNRFEALGGDRQGQCSIRINKQWRIRFEWPDSEHVPFDIEIVDFR